MADPKTSRTTVFAAAAVVLLIVVGLVLAQALGGDDDSDGVSTAAGASESPTVKLPPAGECNEPPALPKQPKQYDAPPTRISPRAPPGRRTWRPTAERSSWDCTATRRRRPWRRSCSSPRTATGTAARATGS